MRNLNTYEDWWKVTTKQIAKKLGISEVDLANKRAQAEEKISLLDLFRDQTAPAEAADIWIKNSGFIRTWGLKEIAWAISQGNAQVSQLLISVTPEQLATSDDFRALWTKARDVMSELKDILEPEFARIHEEKWGDRFIFPCTCGKIRVTGIGAYELLGEDECCVHGFGDVVTTPEQLEELLSKYLCITSAESDAKYTELQNAGASKEEYDSVPLGFHSIATKDFAALVTRVGDDLYEVTEKIIPAAHRRDYHRPPRNFTKARLLKRYFPE